MWLLSASRIITKTYRRKWAPDFDMLCFFCGLHSEDVNHLMIVCPISQAVWAAIGCIFNFTTPFCTVQQMWQHFKNLQVTSSDWARRLLLALIPHAIARRTEHLEGA